MPVTQKPLPPAPGTVSLPGLIAFESVARHLNFTRAAAEMEITPTAISRTIKLLEASMRVRLFNRTTRSVSLTEAGTQLLQTLGPALDQIRRSVQEVGDASGAARGQLRINTSYVAHATLIQPHLREFLTRYPELAVEVSVEHGLTDIVAGGFDVGIRLGRALQKDMIAVPIGPPQRLLVVGAPAYVKARGKPRRPDQLLQHDCIRQRIGNRGQFLPWEFRVGNEPLTIDIQGRLVFSEMRSALEAACDGNGLAFVFEHFAHKALEDGLVVPLLETFTRAREPFYVYYPNRAQMPGKLRAFLQFFQDKSRAAA
ncbi:LysR family transcriptional regulator [Cupriavidus plantarum]|uniref:LysR family transcriptional regulator n=1 Tax=Cupriavidus plantarum TaxID=942865 RepID=UPI0015CC4035|nr:LysR family transcriptional regulator [Cupriavidus plantarum]NYI01804.1 DNA-binding transcriptional LysR family regulator [Cupriavidus plantarum]